MSSINQLILASQSPFRRQLLASTGLVFETVQADVDESAIGGDSPEQVALNRARAKALQVARGRPDALVIGADQVLSLGPERFDKATSPEEAAARLRYLAGKTHALHSALALVRGSEGPAEPLVLASRVISVAMPMRALTPVEIDAYVATGEWRGSVGCYQYENRGAHLFAGVDADQSAIVGLPLAPLLAMLREVGVHGLLQPAPPW